MTSLRWATRLLPLSLDLDPTGRIDPLIEPLRCIQIR
jgi:hypothetical protein